MAVAPVGAGDSSRGRTYCRSTTAANGSADDRA